MTARPVGIFVHHQGRGHAERSAAIANALVAQRPVTLFCAKPRIFKGLDRRAEVVELPSLFEPTGAEAPLMAALAAPETVHCAPLGWPGIRRAMARIAGWFEEARPVLFLTDVSAELGQFARLCSVPHVAVLQHGERSDPGHVAAYESAVGLLAPFSRELEQADRPQWMKDKTHYAPGIGIDLPAMPSRQAARAKLDLPREREVVCVVAGSGGNGTPTAPLTLGAREDPDSLWITIGNVASEWHETPPGNLVHQGWVDNPMDWIAAADRIVSSCGNTTVHTVLAAGKPWVVVPEWRYFDEQVLKAEALDRAGLAAVSRTWPAHAASWRHLWDAAARLETNEQARFLDPAAAEGAAEWIEGLCRGLWGAPEGSEPARILAEASAPGRARA
ncbi:MAG: hypothetical protein V2I39_10680 [Erythrobacter sp.]|jgi:hypothetical protein|nr:hypothetical protein [Erythrobacter sp.]